MFESQEKNIRKELEKYTCKNVEDLIMNYLTCRCECCSQKDLVDNFVLSYRSRDEIGTTFLCQDCIKNLRYFYCFRCKIYTQSAYQILDFHICNYCSQCAGNSMWCE